MDKYFTPWESKFLLSEYKLRLDQLEKETIILNDMEKDLKFTWVMGIIFIFPLFTLKFKYKTYRNQQQLVETLENIVNAKTKEI